MSVAFFSCAILLYNDRFSAKFAHGVPVSLVGYSLSPTTKPKDVYIIKLIFII